MGNYFEMHKSERINTASPEAGFSLIEAIITVVIFLIIMAAIFGVLRAGNVMRNTVSDRSEIVENARTAINFLGREAVNAGLGYSRTGAVVPDDLASDLFEIPKDPGKDRDLFPAVIAGNDIRNSSLSVSGQKNDVIVFISRDLQFNNGNHVVITDFVANAGFAAPKLTTPLGACSACRKYDLYLIESAGGKQALAMATKTDNEKIEVDVGDPLGLNRSPFILAEERTILSKCLVGETSNCFSYSPQATAKRVFMTSYSVDADGTLIRTNYGNLSGGTAAQQIQKQPLAYGVQNFQVRYLMQDGTITDDPSNGYVDQMRLNEVVQVEINITIKSETNKEGVTSTQLINLDSTFSMRNLRYDFE